PVTASTCKCETIGSSSTEGVGPGSPAGSSGEGTVFFAAGSASLLVRIGGSSSAAWAGKAVSASRVSREDRSRETGCLTVFSVEFAFELAGTRAGRSSWAMAEGGGSSTRVTIRYSTCWSEEEPAFVRFVRKGRLEPAQLKINTWIKMEISKAL